MRSSFYLGVAALLALLAGAPQARCQEPPIPRVLPTPEPSPSPCTTSVGLCDIRFDGLLQAWYQDFGGDNTFRMRRAELKLSGTAIKDRVGWVVMFDPAKVLGQAADKTIIQATRILQDAYVTLNYIPYTVVEVGQTRVPIGLESTMSPGLLWFAERPVLSAQIFDKRDLGVKFRFHYPLWSGLDLQAGIFNGEELNQLDLNADKDVAARLTVWPMPWLQLGASHYQGLATARRFDKVRTSADLMFALGIWDLHGEYFRVLNGGPGGTVAPGGWYGSLGCQVLPELQLATRYENFRQDRNVPHNTEQDVTFGINYLLSGQNVKLQADYVLRFLDGRSRDQYRDQFISSLQVMF